MALGVLVGHFGQFVRAQYDARPGPPAIAEAFPDTLARLHKSFGHHIIPLSLLARADGDSAVAEQKAIVDHCLSLAASSGQPATGDEKAALEAYIGTFRPSLMQLDLALKRLENDPGAQIEAFLNAAQAVVEADGVTRPAEAQFFARLRSDLRNEA